MLLSFVTMVWSIMNTVFRGFLIKTFWAWFVLSIFPSLPAIAVLPAIGLSYVVSIFTPHRSLSGEEIEKIRASDSSDGVGVLTFNCFVTTIILLCSWFGGWILHLLMA